MGGFAADETDFLASCLHGNDCRSLRCFNGLTVGQRRCLNVIAIWVALLTMGMAVFALPVWLCLVTAVTLYLLGLLVVPKQIAFLLTVSMLAWLYATFTLHHANHQIHQITRFGSATLVGKIITIPEQHAHYLHLEVKASSWNGQVSKARLQINWYQPYPTVHVGDVWQWQVNLKPYHGLSNPASNHWQRDQRFHGIAARGYVISHTKPRCLYSGNTWSLSALRQYGLSLIHHHVGRNADSAILAALTLGIRSGLTDQQWQLFQHTGTSHLMSVSGLHITGVAWLFYSLSYRLWCCFPRVLLRVPAPWFAMSVSMVVALGYALLSGWGLPAQRACWMLCVILLGQCVIQPRAWSDRLMIAVFIIFALNPLAVQTASFWLSVTAIVWIGYALLIPCRVGGRLGVWIKIQYFLFIGLFPLNAAFFGMHSGLGWLANAWAVPWVACLALPISLVSMVMAMLHCPGAHAGMHLSMLLIHCLQWGLTEMSRHCQWSWYQAIQGAACYYLILATGLFCLPWGTPMRAFAVFLSLPAFFPSIARPSFASVWMTVLDVGQGLSVVVQTAHHVMIYDTGPHTYSGFDAGQQVVLPYWRQLHYPAVDKLVISHGDNDHAGGALTLLSQGIVQSLVTSDLKQFSAWQPQACMAGESWSWDGVRFTTLWPPKDFVYQGNNSSCVLRIDSGVHVILLTGDIEQPVEHRLLQSSSNALPVTVLVAPHHGSDSSSSWPWVTAVNPALVIYPQGFMNRYHFPAQVVVQRYNRVHAMQYLTSEQGAVRVQLNANGQVAVQSYRNF